jgi:hypothetical protein
MPRLQFYLRAACSGLRSSPCEARRPTGFLRSDLTQRDQFARRRHVLDDL